MPSANFSAIFILRLFLRRSRTQAVQYVYEGNICTLVDLFDKAVAGGGGGGASNHCGNEVRR